MVCYPIHFLGYPGVYEAMTWKRVAAVLLIKLGVLAALVGLIAIIGSLCFGGMLLTLYIVHLYLFSFDDPVTATKFIVGFVICVPFLHMMGHSWKILERYQWFQKLDRAFTYPFRGHPPPK